MGDRRRDGNRWRLNLLALVVLTAAVWFALTRGLPVVADRAGGLADPLAGEPGPAPVSDLPAPAALVPATATLHVASDQAAPSEPPALPARHERAVPILMYHVIAPGPNNLFVPPAELESHLAYLKREGYEGITLSQLYAHFRSGSPLPERPVVLTFDDGYSSFYTDAFPLLQQYGFTATLFVITNLVEKQGYITWAQARELVAARIEMGAHTVSHPDLRQVSAKGLQTEIAGSRAVLESQLGVAVPFFAYPAGRYDERALAALKEARFWGAVTTVPGFATNCQDPLQWSRVRIDPKLTPERLGRLLKGLEGRALTGPDCPPPVRTERAEGPWR